MSEAPDSLEELLTRDHRRLDDLFGRFLAALQSGDAAAAREAIERFDEALRRHTALEEEHLFPEPAGHKLAPAEREGESERRFRELRLEHVQVREVSGMIVRLLSEKQDLEAARRLAPNLARRWDAHTEREEREVYPNLESKLGRERADRARKVMRSSSRSGG